MPRWIDLAFALAGLTGLGAAQPLQTNSTEAGQGASQEVGAAKLEEKGREIEALNAKASGITKAMAELAQQGKIPTTQEGVQALRDMVDQLDQIRQALEAIQKELDGIKAWIKGQEKTVPAVEKAVADLKRHRWGNYIQFQYRDTNQIGGSPDAFSLRRVRLGFTEQIDPRTALRASFDLATGTTATTPQLRDAFVRWDLAPTGKVVGTELYAGQMAMPLGYELARSSTDREFPERTHYNRVLFAGERGRGINVRHGLDEKNVVHLGLWNALTWDDPEQRTVAPGPENRLGVSGGWRTTGKNWDFGISGFFGKRPKVATTRTVGSSTVTTVHPRIDREIVYVDGSYFGLFDPKLFVRFEVMAGKDRVPVTPGANQSVTAPRAQVDLGGHQIHLGYLLNPRNQVNVRYEAWDPDRDVDGNTAITWAAAYTYFIHPSARLTASHEWVDDPSRASIPQERYRITTLRVVFKF